MLGHSLLVWWEGVREEKTSLIFQLNLYLLVDLCFRNLTFIHIFQVIEVFSLSLYSVTRLQCS